MAGTSERGEMVAVGDVARVARMWTLPLYDVR
jgi:hypothetical protein